MYFNNRISSTDETVHAQGKTDRLFDFGHTLGIKGGDDAPHLRFLHGLQVIDVDDTKLGRTIFRRGEQNFGGNIAHRRRDRRDGDAGQETEGGVAGQE